MLMDQSNRAGAPESSRLPVHAAAIALRGIGQMCDMNMEAARVLLHTQARAAAAFGFPDMSRLFDAADERARHAFSAGAEQMLSATQRANEAAVELQRQIGRVVETQAATAAENWQRGIEELGAQADEGLAQLCETARQQAEEAQRMTQQLGQQAREGLQRGGEQVRGQMQEGAGRVRDALSAAGNAAEEKERPRKAG
jgi:ElaB/YqjD/DUF883 family membrane-anchored ribosome-binding protein